MNNLNLVTAIFIKKSNNDYIISDIFKSALQYEKFYLQINEILDFALERYKNIIIINIKILILFYIKNILMKKFVIY